MNAENMPTIGDVTSLGIPVLLTLVCNLFAEGLKRATNGAVKRWLPLICMALGGVTYPCVASVSELKINAENPTVYLIMVGAAIGGLSVGLNQLVRQFTSRGEPASGGDGPGPLLRPGGSVPPPKG